MANPLQRLHEFGQSFWYDNIRRDLLRTGELERMVKQDGLRGLTSNPTIFAKALAHGSDYDDGIRKSWTLPAAEIFLGLMIEDIQSACDVLRPVFDASAGEDGYCSIEVFPELARKPQATIEQARMLWKRVGRPNVMVKIPSTPECIPAIAQALEEGINVNITLMFGFESYRAVVEAYIGALEKRLARGERIHAAASVASLFVSRVDTKLDPRLATAGADGKSHPELQGKAGIANARRMYRYFQEAFRGPRWEKLAAAGARPQRLLWASTSTKNPKYPDTLYADALIGPQTVDTMPDQTVEAFRDHGHPADRLNEAMTNYATEVEPVLNGLAAAGVDMEAAARELQDEGVDSFQASYVELIAGLRQKVARLSQTIRGPQKDMAAAAAAFEQAKQAQASQRVAQPPAEAARLWSGDAAVQAKIANRLGWLRLPETMLGAIGEIQDFAEACRQAGYKHAVLLGMGGSSLAPEVFSRIFAGVAGTQHAMRLHVLDTTNPDQIATVEKRIQLAETLFLVSSKSGGTVEPNSLFAYFWSKLGDGSHYAAITDAGTSLEKLAQAHGFRKVFTNPGDIGGRYSALSFFGLVPAALAGVDLELLLLRAQAMAEACGPNVPPEQNPALELGTAIGAWAKAGRDKLTFVAGEDLASLGAWLEQLIAESTGKLGRGVVPVAGEALGATGVYGADRVFAELDLETAAKNVAADAQPASSAPTVRLVLRDRYDLGREFFRWEYATAMAGLALEINPFDEPNVQESKDNTTRVLQQFLQGGAKAAGFEAAPNLERDGLKLYAPQKAGLGEWLASVKPGDYVAIMAYLERAPEIETALEKLRIELRDALQVATTLGFGPRFLHSTGQLHKGGANTGVFLQITAPPRGDLPIPGQRYTFATLLRAQAMGDYEALDQHGRRLLRVDVGSDTAAAVRKLTEAAKAALAHSSAGARS